MKTKNRTAHKTAPFTTTAKVQDEKDIAKVFEFFRYKTGTTYDCAKSTCVKRWSITWYVKQLIEEGLLVCCYIGPDDETGRMSKHYCVPENLRKEARDGQ